MKVVTNCSILPFLVIIAVVVVGTAAASAFTISTTTGSCKRSTATSIFGVSLDNEKQENHHHHHHQTTTSVTATAPSPPNQQQRQEQERLLLSKFGRTTNVLQTSDLVGNFGFDPFGLATSETKLHNYREAEIKHARLAMLAATFVLATELYDRVLAEYWGMDLELVEYDEEYSTMMMVNNNLDYVYRVSPTLWGTLLGFMAAIELSHATDRRSRRGGENDDYFAGNLGFDPANLYPTQWQDQKRVQKGELQNGRLAMVGLAVYFWQSIMDSGIVPFEFRMMGLSMVESSSSSTVPSAL